MLFDIVKQGRLYYENDKKSRDEILKISLNSFRNIVKYAYIKSPFYKEFYSSYNIKYEDLDEISPDDIPIIDKKAVKENFFKIPTRIIDKDRYKNFRLFIYIKLYT